MEHVLYEVFSYFLISEQTVLARVCKRWFHCVISSMYKDVHISEAVAPLGGLMLLSSDGYFVSDLLISPTTI